MGKCTKTDKRRKSVSRTRKSKVEPSIKKASRKQADRKKKCAKICLTEVPAVEDGQEASLLSNGAIVALAVVKMTTIITDELKSLRTMRRNSEPNAEASNRSRSSRRSISNSKPAESAETENDNKSKPSRFDLMKYRSPSPPKRSSARKSSSARQSDESNSPKRNFKVKQGKWKRSTRAKANVQHRSRRDSSSSGKGDGHRSRSRRSSTEPKSCTRLSTADDDDEESDDDIVEGEATGTPSGPTRGILKTRKGPYPSPCATIRLRAGPDKKVKFSRKVDIRYYYCNLTKAKRYNRYRDRQ